MYQGIVSLENGGSFYHPKRSAVFNTKAIGKVQKCNLANHPALIPFIFVSKYLAL